jgi:hypothetical protein
MGANAQIEVPAFTAGQVLTAAEMTQVNTGIPVFATTVTRDAAFGGAGEKVLAQGQYAYIEATSTLQVYTGSAWVTATSGLTYITGTTFSGATTVSLPTNTFTSTYSNYRIIFSSVLTSSTLTMRYRTAGTDNTASSYIYARNGFDGTATLNVGASFTTSNNIAYGWDTASNHTWVFDVYRPQETAFTNITWAGHSAPASYGGVGATTGYGVFQATTSFDALTFISSVASNLTGTYRVYGYQNS